MNRFTFVDLAVGQNRSLEGLQVTVNPDRSIESDSRILGAWLIGHRTIHGRDCIIPGRDWLAMVWRDPDGQVRSFGRIRNYREHLGVEDAKVFYTATAAGDRELLKIYDRVAGRLSREWGVRQHKALDLDGRRLTEWLRAVPDVMLTLE